MSLHPTKTRLALLQAVADGAVTEQYPIMPSKTYAEWDHGPGDFTRARRYQRVTARVGELYRAGWIRLGDRLHEGYKAPRRFEITELGRDVLDGAR